MESQVSNLIQDQNLNVHFKGASARGRNNVAKAPRKGALGRRPLGDLSDSIQPTPKQLKKKQNSSMLSFTEKKTGSSKLTSDGSKKKTSGWKVLSDISNSWKQQLNEAPKKNLSTKVSVVAEEDLDIAKEGFLHNHEECIKAHTKAMDIDEFLKTVGLKIMTSPCSTQHHLHKWQWMICCSEDEFPWKHEEFSDHDSPPPCGSSPKSPNHFMMWDEDTIDDFDIMSFESPNCTLIESP